MIKNILFLCVLIWIYTEFINPQGSSGLNVMAIASGIIDTIVMLLRNIQNVLLNI